MRLPGAAGPDDDEAVVWDEAEQVRDDGEQGGRGADAQRLVAGLGGHDGIPPEQGSGKGMPVSGGAGSCAARPTGGQEVTPGRTCGVGLLTGRQVVRLAVGGGGAGGLAVGVAGAQRVEGHRGGDLAGPQGDPGAGLPLSVLGQASAIRSSARTVTRSPLRTDSAVRLASTPKAVTLTQRVMLSPVAAGHFEGQAELDAGGAFAGGEGAGVIAEAAGDGDGDGVHGFSLVCGPGEPAALVAARGLRCPSRRSGARDTDAGARTPGGPGKAKMFPSGKERTAPAEPVPEGVAAAGKDLWPPG